MSKNTQDTSNGKKSKYAFWLRPEIDSMIDSHLSAGYAASRSDFIEHAVKHYCGVLDTKESREFLGDEIVKSMRAIIHDTEGRIFSHLRSMDIGQSMLVDLIAGYLTDLTEDQIEESKRNAIRFLNTQHRAQSFVEGWRVYQNSGE